MKRVFAASFAPLFLVACASAVDAPLEAQSENLVAGTTLPKVRLGDKPAIVLTGLPANTKVDVTACRGNPFSSDPASQFTSKVRFKSSRSGTIDFTRDAPLSGAYTGADAFGVLWSMSQATCPFGATPTANEVIFDVVPTGAAARRVTLPIEDGDPTVVTSDTSVEQEGFRGKLYRPAGAGALPGLVVWGGSDGVLAEDLGRFFSARGYATLAIQYFDYVADGVTFPNLIKNIPLEYFGKAITFLASKPFVKDGKVSILGGSRGGEAALLVGTKYGSLLKSVVAQRPTDLAWGDRANGTFSKFMDNPPEEASWTFGGQPIPFVPMKKLLQELSTESVFQGIPAFKYRTAYEKAEAQASAGTLAAARIDVASIPVPLFVSAGSDDGLWTAPTAVRRIKQLRTAAGKADDDVFLTVEGAGHYNSAPGRPTGPDLQFLFPSGVYDKIIDGQYVPAPEWAFNGGTAKRNFVADREISAATLKFLANTAK